jgi:hypothetical protein
MPPKPCETPECKEAAAKMIGLWKMSSPSFSAGHLIVSVQAFGKCDLYDKNPNKDGVMLNHNEKDGKMEVCKWGINGERHLSLNFCNSEDDCKTAYAPFNPKVKALFEAVAKAGKNDVVLTRFKEEEPVSPCGEHCENCEPKTKMCTKWKKGWKEDANAPFGC